MVWRHSLVIIFSLIRGASDSRQTPHVTYRYSGLSPKVCGCLFTGDRWIIGLLSCLNVFRLKQSFTVQCCGLLCDWGIESLNVCDWNSVWSVSTWSDHPLVNFCEVQWTCREGWCVTQPDSVCLCHVVTSHHWFSVHPTQERHRWPAQQMVTTHSDIRNFTGVMHRNMWWLLSLGHVSDSVPTLLACWLLPGLGNLLSWLQYTNWLAM